jgi:hypothetical protein
MSRGPTPRMRMPRCSGNLSGQAPSSSPRGKHRADRFIQNSSNALKISSPSSPARDDQEAGTETPREPSTPVANTFHRRTSVSSELSRAEEPPPPRYSDRAGYLAAMDEANSSTESLHRGGQPASRAWLQPRSNSQTSHNVATDDGTRPSCLSASMGLTRCSEDVDDSSKNSPTSDSDEPSHTPQAFRESPDNKAEEGTTLPDSNTVGALFSFLFSRSSTDQLFSSNGHPGAPIKSVVASRFVRFSGI